MVESTVRASIKSKLVSARAISLTVGGASVVLALIASFGLAQWAEAASFNHGIQHILLFTAGAGVGGSALTFITSSRKVQK